MFATLLGGLPRPDPDLDRAMRSASNSLSMIVEEHIHPFTREDGGQPKTREMHLHRLPWPLDELEALGELNLRNTIEETIFNVSANWYQLIQLNYASEVLEDAITITKERFDLANARVDVGAGSGLDVVQAQVDLNEDSSALLNLQLQM